MRKALTLFLPLFMALPAAAQDAAPAVVPIKEVVLSDGARRYTIPLTIGATKVEAGLDTGSSGLRVLPNVLKAEDAQESRKSDTYSYGSGAEFEGVIGEAKVAVGDAAAGTTTLQLIKTVGCRERQPECPAAKVALKDYGIQGDGLKGEGFKAIIGTNMADAEVASPLSALGAKRWIVELPLPGATRPGRLILNPSADQAEGFTMFHVDPAYRATKGALHDAIAACLVNDRTKQQICGPALLDSGAPGINIVNGPGGAPWPNGTLATIAFIENGHPVSGIRLTIGQRAQASRLTFSQRPEVTGTRLMLGIAPFFGYAVLYDPAAGMIGLKPR